MMGSGQKSRILIVDDEPFIREICADLLRLEYAQGQQIIVDQPTDGKSGTLGKNRPIAGSDRKCAEVVSCSVCEASSGREAIDLVTNGLSEENPFDLVICDIRMPGMDGVTAAEQLIQLDDKIEIIFASAFSQYEEEDIRKRMNKDVGFIQKPYDMGAFVETVGSYLCRIKARKRELGGKTPSRSNVDLREHEGANSG